MEAEKLLDLFTDMARLHTAYVERRLLHLGLHAGQGGIISALGEHGPSSQKELAEYRHVSAATISVMLRRMENSGSITRAASTDGKGNQISLTEEGQRLFEELCRNREGEADRLFEGLDDEELAVSERVFRIISENLKNLTS